MKKSISLLIFAVFISFTGCSNDDNNTTGPVNGEVLLATVSGDSVGVSSGFSSRSSSITSGQLNFTDRSNARITFSYSSGPENTALPFSIIYSDSIVLYSGNLTNNATDQFIDTTFASPNVDSFFKYKISVGSAAPSFFKFKDLKIYKK